MSKNKRLGQQILRQKSLEDQLRMHFSLRRVPNGFRPKNTLEELEPEIEKIRNKTSSLSSNERKATVINYFRLLEQEKSHKNLDKEE